nr:trypsin-like peptidase domain-containing protein [Leptospira ognonensis]
MIEKLTFMGVRGFLLKETIPAIAEQKAVIPVIANSKILIRAQVKSMIHRLQLSTIILLSVNVFASEIQIDTQKKISIDTIKKGVVQIKVYSQSQDPYSPWLSGNVTASTGTGFLIGENKILTNAHVVSNAKFIEAQRNNQTEWYELKTLFVAHDCDLAILEAKAPEFYEDSYSFALGPIPELGSPVDIVGYPIGGNKISISRGIVSRIEQSTYAHSQIDSHLVIQVDAAINPGNSGGPAIQDGSVVGVAFQASTKGENIGYIIPKNVIEHFLKDIEDGKYDGYVELGIHYQPSYSLSERLYRKIPKDVEGVFVTKILQGGSAFGLLEKGDLIHSIDGLKLGKNGTVAYNGESRIDFVEIVDNKFAGEEITLEVIRKGERMILKFPAKRMPALDLMRSRYDVSYSYFILAGLVFQPMNRDLLETWAKSGQTQGGSQFLYRFNHLTELGNEETEEIILYRKLSHPINSSADYFLNMVVETVNGKPINNLNAFANEIQNSKAKYITIYFKDISLPLIVNREDAINSDLEIKKSYNVSGK